jgi:hypothetical protein
MNSSYNIDSSIAEKTKKYNKRSKEPKLRDITKELDGNVKYTDIGTVDFRRVGN